MTQQPHRIEEKEAKRISDLIKGDFHDEMANLFAYGVSQKTIAMLVNIHICLQEELEMTQNKLTMSQTKIETLKARIKELEAVANSCEGGE